MQHEIASYLTVEKVNEQDRNIAEIFSNQKVL